MNGWLSPPPVNIAPSDERIEKVCLKRCLRFFDLSFRSFRYVSNDG